MEITQAKPITELTTEKSKQLQALLNNHGYGLVVDGIVGEKTIGAFNDFKRRNHLGYPNLLGATTLEKLKEKPQGKVHDFSTRDGVVQAIIWECNQHNLRLKSQHAYVIATTEWETARTFKPVRESYWWDNQHGFAKAEEMRRNHHNIRRYFPYYGRGFVQLTWRGNYQRYSNILGIDLVSNPDLAMNPNVSLFILCHGFKHGIFTGRRLEHYVNSKQKDFINARRVINGTDKAREIANLAIQWERRI